MMTIVTLNRRGVLPISLVVLLLVTQASGKSMGRTGRTVRRHQRHLMKDTPAPTPFPTATPTQKQMGGGNMNVAADTLAPSSAQSDPWWTEWTEKPVARATPWPTFYEVFTAPPTDAPVTDPPVTDPPTSESPVTASPSTRAPVTAAPITSAPRTSTVAPTSSPSAQPVAAASAEPSPAPVSVPPVTKSPSGTPIMSPTSGPTSSPSKVPVREVPVGSDEAPVVETEKPVPVPIRSPSLKPSLAPIVNSTTSTNMVALSEFSILMISQSNTINLGELERTLESYLQNQMRFTDIESISLTLLEGDSKENRNFTSTSVRFSAVAFFRSAPPLESEVRAEQGFLLMAIPELQIEISSNQALQGVSVADVSFEKIDTVSPMDEGDTSSSTNRRELGILLGAFSATVVAIASALLIVRFRRMARKQRYNLTSKTIPEPPPSITEVKQDYYEEEEAAVHVKPGCQSLCSGDVSLGDGDLSTYMMTASPKTYNIHAKDDGNNIKAGSSSTANNSSTDMHHKPPTEEISIRQSDVFDYDDNYLTTDETSVAL